MHVAANRWYAMLTPDEVPADRPLAARRLGQDLVFWRDGSGAIRAAVDICPHRRAKLSPGSIRDGCLTCPFHGFRFDGEGACVHVPAHPERKISPAMSLHVLPVREEHGFVWLWTGPDPAPIAPVPFFDFEGWDYAGSAFTEPVASHYTRAIENQLDFAHLAFVHESTIGRFATEAVDVQTEVDGDRIAARVPDQEGEIEFVGPGIWRLRTGPQWQFLAFVPVDEDRMLYYVRIYARPLPVPGLGWLMGKLNAFFSRIVLRQDTPVVESQPAEETRLRMGEVLVPSDGPIIAYRRWREQVRVPFEPGVRLRRVPARQADQKSA